MPKNGWTCFHCGETFTTPGSARDHFGTISDIAGCQIKVGEERGLLMEIRKIQASERRLIAENEQLDHEAGSAAIYRRENRALREFIRISVIARGDVPEDIRKGAMTVLDKDAQS